MKRKCSRLQGEKRHGFTKDLILTGRGFSQRFAVCYPQGGGARGTVFTNDLKQLFRSICVLIPKRPEFLLKSCFSCSLASIQDIVFVSDVITNRIQSFSLSFHMTPDADLNFFLANCTDILHGRTIFVHY